MIALISKIKLFFVRLFLVEFAHFLIPKNQKSILFWREYFFNIVFFFFFIVNSIAFVFSMIRQISTQSLPVILINVFLYLLTIFIVYTRSINFRVRSFIGSSIFLAIGLYLFVSFGPAVGGLFWFFLFSLFSAAFNGIPGVIYSNAAIAAAVAAFVVLIPIVDFRWVYLTPDFYHSNTWWLTGVSLFFLNLIASVSVQFFMGNLEKAILRNADSRNAIIFGLASLTEFRDRDTGKHLERISKYSVLLARELKKQKKYQSYITEEYIEDLEMSSILHDIGKVGIEDKILLKENKLSRKEFEKIKLHPAIGAKVIDKINKRMRDKNFLKLAHQIILHHHEKWDGSGYPRGLKGNDIPLSARIVALADVYDALISRRSYKSAMDHETAAGLILREKGRHFDPEIVNIFRKANNDFKTISRL